MTDSSYSLMVHGGAGALDNVRDDKTAMRYLESIRSVVEHGRDVLQNGGSALQAVEACASLLEDDPVFNAGCGSVLNEQAKVEMDAAIMDGKTFNAGAVAAVHNISNPVQLARRVLAHSEHVMLIADGAMEFARQQGMELVGDDYFLTEERLAQWQEAHDKHKIMLDHDDADEGEDENTGDQKYGTIGAVAYDLEGNLAAATSTGGIVNKRWGRVGDSPIIGAGVYADNESCAVSTTGYGEDFMRTVIAKTVADHIELLGQNAFEATQAGIVYLNRKVKGRGGMIVIDHEGYCSSGFTTKKMIHGWVEHGGETMARF